MTVLLDTNVASELTRKAPDPTVAVRTGPHQGQRQGNDSPNTAKTP